MNIVATYDHFLDLGSGSELVLRGQTVNPPGTGRMSRDERARSLIRQGAAVLPEAWPKIQSRTEANVQAATKMVDQARAASDKHRRGRA